MEDRSPWLQVNLKNPYIITRIATQGFGGNINQWVKKYRITWENDEGIWYNYSVPRRFRSLAVHWNTKVIFSHSFLFTIDLSTDTAAILNHLDLRSIMGYPEGMSTFRYTVKPVLSGYPLLSGHLSKSRKSLPLVTVNLTSIKRSPLLSGRGHPF